MLCPRLFTGTVICYQLSTGSVCLSPTLHWDCFVPNSPLGLCALSPSPLGLCSVHNSPLGQCVCPQLSTGSMCSIPNSPLGLWSVPNSPLGLCGMSLTLHWDCVVCPQLSTGTVWYVPNSPLGLCGLSPTLHWDCVLSTTLHWDCVVCPQVLDDWNKGELSSFLIEITRDIVKFTDTDGQPLLEKIRDTAGQVGQWVIIGLDRYKTH